MSKNVKKEKKCFHKPCKLIIKKKPTRSVFTWLRNHIEYALIKNVYK